MDNSLHPVTPSWGPYELSDISLFMATSTGPRSHPLHHPESPRRQRQAIPTDGSVFPWRVHCAPDGAAVALRHAVGDFSDRKRVTCSAKPAQRVAILTRCAPAPSRKPKTQAGALSASANRYPRLPGIYAMTRELWAPLASSADCRPPFLAPAGAGLNWPRHFSPTSSHQGPAAISPVD
jgi:hypothetical protein